MKKSIILILGLILVMSISGCISEICPSETYPNESNYKDALLSVANCKGDLITCNDNCLKLYPDGNYATSSCLNNCISVFNGCYKGAVKTV